MCFESVFADPPTTDALPPSPQAGKPVTGEAKPENLARAGAADEFGYPLPTEWDPLSTEWEQSDFEVWRKSGYSAKWLKIHKKEPIFGPWKSQRFAIKYKQCVNRLWHLWLSEHLSTKWLENQKLKQPKRVIDDLKLRYRQRVDDLWHRWASDDLSKETFEFLNQEQFESVINALAADRVNTLMADWISQKKLFSQEWLAKRELRDLKQVIDALKPQLEKLQGLKQAHALGQAESLFAQKSKILQRMKGINHLH